MLDAIQNCLMYVYFVAFTKPHMKYYFPKLKPLKQLTLQLFLQKVIRKTVLIVSLKENKVYFQRNDLRRV